MLALTIDGQSVTAPRSAAIRARPSEAGMKASAGVFPRPRARAGRQHLSVLRRGVRPLHGRSDVQGESDAALIPMVHPYYERGVDPQIHDRFDETGGAPRDPNTGLTAAEATQ